LRRKEGKEKRCGKKKKIGIISDLVVQRTKFAKRGGASSTKKGEGKIEPLENPQWGEFQSASDTTPRVPCLRLAFPREMGKRKKPWTHGMNKTREEGRCAFR